MIINAQTKISQLLKENPAALDAISSLAKPLEKLRNPLLRKLMASRTSIQEAASIGGCSVEEFFLALRPLGFEPELSSNVKTITVPVKQPDWLSSLTPDQITQLDVRPQLSAGHDPLKEIMSAYKNLGNGCVLEVINSFVPTPLFSVLEKKGALTYYKNAGARQTHSYFYKPPLNESAKQATKTASTALAEKEQINTLSKQDFQLQLSGIEPSLLQEIDVRALEIPGPMQTILSALDRLPVGGGLYVHHKRIPVYLLEDLQQTGKTQVYILPIEETRVDLLLMHKA